MNTGERQQGGCSAIQGDRVLRLQCSVLSTREYHDFGVRVLVQLVYDVLFSDRVPCPNSCTSLRTSSETT